MELASPRWHHIFWRSCQLEDVHNKELLKLVLLSLLGLLHSLKTCDVWVSFHFKMKKTYFPCGMVQIAFRNFLMTFKWGSWWCHYRRSYRLVICIIHYILNIWNVQIWHSYANVLSTQNTHIIIIVVIMFI